MKNLKQQLQELVNGFDGRVGIGIRSKAEVITLRPGERFSLQSVMKLILAAAVMDAVDRNGWKLSEPILVRREDLSLSWQPMATKVGKNGYRTTIGDLVSRSVNESDSAATDILFARVGGAAVIRRFLERIGMSNVMRVDRDERRLQTEIAGISWQPEYVDAAILEKAKQSVPTPKRDDAYRAYARDVRDTATPDGMASFLYALAVGKVLKPASTRHLLAVMRKTITGPGRLTAGVPRRWTLGHKTGTSSSHGGVTVATNNVGILTAPDGHQIAVAVFVAGSRRSEKERDALIAAVAHAIITDYQSSS